MKTSTYWIIALCVVFAAVFFSLGVSSQDILGDEASYAFRSAGYLDYLGTNFQTQPVDWYKDGELPWWTKLSFHDHPPLVFLAQYLFFSVFGISPLAAKLPSIFAGVISLLLMVLIVKEFFGKDSNKLIFTAIFGAASSGLIWLSRSGLMEPIQLAFILGAVYFFLRFEKEPSRFWLLGLFLGLSLLAKYTSVFLLPLFFFYLFIKNRKVTISWRFWVAIFIAFVVLTPVIVYNVILYKTRGHFDLQIAYFLGQNTPEWTGLAGKTLDPFPDIFKNLAILFGPSLALLSGGLAVALIVFLLKRREKQDSAAFGGDLFFFLYLVFLTVMLYKIGSAPRFLALYIPAMVYFSARFAAAVWESDKLRWLSRASVAILSGGMIFFAYQQNFAKAYDYGIAKLDRYFQDELRGKVSGAMPQSDNPHLNKIINSRYKSNPVGIPRHYSMIVYNDNVAQSTLLWIYYRYFFYDAIPTLYLENFIRVGQREGDGYFKNFTLYFVQSTPDTLLNTFKTDKKIPNDFEVQFLRRGHGPDKVIYGSGGREMFRIYKFTLGG